MSQNDMENIRLAEEKIIKKYGLWYGKVIVIQEKMVKDLDSGEFVVVTRVAYPTNMTKEVLIANLEEQRISINEKNLEEIDKINALE